ncbi:MAG: hypothetical protein ACFHVJ_13730 [Aestuariibacter sp.]
MKILTIALIAIVALLSIAAGLAKLMAVPEEVQFLQQFGFNALAISLYGVIQVSAGLLLSIPKSRMIGVAITIVAFGLSTVLIFVSGNYIFGLVSLLPIALVIVIAIRFIEYKKEPAIIK